MGDFLLGLLIPIGILILIITIFIIVKNTREKTPIIQKGTTATQGTLVTGNNTTVGNIIHKTKSKFWSKVAEAMGFIILFVLTVALLFWVIGIVGKTIKELNAPKPHLISYTLQTVKTVQISNTSGTNTVYVPWGTDARFKKATIAFCVENNLGESVCGDVGSDPELPKGRTGEGQTLWFIPRDDPNQSGTIEILVTETKQKVVYY